MQYRLLQLLLRSIGLGKPSIGNKLIRLLFEMASSYGGLVLASLLFKTFLISSMTHMNNMVGRILLSNLIHLVKASLFDFQQPLTLPKLSKEHLGLCHFFS